MKATIGNTKIECVDSFCVGVNTMYDMVNNIIDEIIKANTNNSTAIKCSMDIKNCVSTIKNDLIKKCNY